MSVINKILNKSASAPVDPNAPVDHQEIQSASPAFSTDPKVQKAIERAAEVSKRKSEREEKLKNYERISLVIRSDFYKQMKIYAAEDNTYYYDVIEDAIREYIQRRSDI